MIHIVIGTKAQLIKMAPILMEIQRKGVKYNLIWTGQHKDTVDELLRNFGLPPFDLVLYSGRDIVSVSQMALWTLRILWKTLTQRGKIFKGDRSGIVLVHGDTFTTVLGALMGRVAGLKVGHVESGLRSFNLFQPFPEELCRMTTFRLAHYYFCPNAQAVENLKQFSGHKINVQSNTIYDSLAEALESMPKITEDHIPKSPYGLVTVHRFENFNTKTSALKVVEAIEKVAEKHKLIFILHKPTEFNLKRLGLWDRVQNNPNIETRPRYDYFMFIKLMLNAEFLLSDGGSNQEECYFLGKPVLLLRNVCEWSEGLNRNAVLSKFNLSTITDFRDNYRKHSFPILNRSVYPSRTIVESCTSFS